ncbi:hypothetical protein [Staphylococcus borealis]
MEEQNKKPQTTHGSEKNEAHGLKTIKLVVNKSGSYIVSHGRKTTISIEF